MTDPRKVRDGGADGQLKRAGSAVRTRGERVSAKPAAAELPGAQVCCKEQTIKSNGTYKHPQSPDDKENKWLRDTNNM